MRKSALLQDLQINKKNYFEEDAFNGASSFFVWFLNKKMNNGMNKRKINTISEEQKMTIQLWLGVSLAIFGIMLIIASFMCPPLGLIETSVLTAIGEIFTFSGSLIGIDYHYKFKKYEIADEREDRYEGSSDDIADDEHNA